MSRSTNARARSSATSRPLPELAELRRAVYVDGKKVFGHDYLKQLTPLSLAVWYMDDGGFTLRAKGVQERTRDGSGRSEICVEAMEPTHAYALVTYLRDTWGITPRLVERGRTRRFSRSRRTRPAKLPRARSRRSCIRRWSTSCCPRYRGRFAVEPVFTPMRYELMPLPITNVAAKPRTRSMHRFDIEVEGTHNYFADGVMVHNSPETTPGGRALKFYSSVRLDIRRIESIKDGAEITGNRTRVKVVKNKCVAAGTKVFDPTTGLHAPHRRHRPRRFG